MLNTGLTKRQVFVYTLDFTTTHIHQNYWFRLYPKSVPFPYAPWGWSLSSNCNENENVPAPPPHGHLFGDWGNPQDNRDIPERGSYDRHGNFADASSTRILYGIDLLLSLACLFLWFFHLNQISASWVIFLGEPASRPNIPFFYHIVLFYLRYLTYLKESSENVFQGPFQTLSRYSHWSRNCFWASWDFALARVEFIEIAVISAYLQLQMR